MTLPELMQRLQDQSILEEHVKRQQGGVRPWHHTCLFSQAMTDIALQSIGKPSLEGGLPRKVGQRCCLAGE